MRGERWRGKKSESRGKEVRSKTCSCVRSDAATRLRSHVPKAGGHEGHMGPRAGDYEDTGEAGLVSMRVITKGGQHW